MRGYGAFSTSYLYVDYVFSDWTNKYLYFYIYYRNRYGNSAQTRKIYGVSLENTGQTDRARGSVTEFSFNYFTLTRTDGLPDDGGNLPTTIKILQDGEEVYQDTGDSNPQVEIEPSSSGSKYPQVWQKGTFINCGSLNAQIKIKKTRNDEEFTTELIYSNRTIDKKITQKMPAKYAIKVIKEPNLCKIECEGWVCFYDHSGNLVRSFKG